MMGTNELLNIGFALVSAFGHVVSIPKAEVPASTNDLAQYFLGRPTPSNILFTTTDGSQYWIEHGVVFGFESAGSYFESQDPHARWKFVGTAAATTNEAVALAWRTAAKLVKTGNPLDGCATNITMSSDIPFCYVSFYRPRPLSGEVADAEVDLRSGRIVKLNLWDKAFWDPVVERTIAEKVLGHELHEEPPPEPQNRLEIYPPFQPRPNASYVKVAIANAQRFCKCGRFRQQLDMNIDSVDWSRTALFAPNWPIPENPRFLGAPFCLLCFKDGSACQCYNGIVTGFWSKDDAYEGAFRRAPEVKARLFGTPVKDWKPLAEKLQQNFVQEFDVPNEHMAHLESRAPVLQLDAASLAQVEVIWVSKEIRASPLLNPSIEANIDLVDGYTTGLNTSDLTLMSDIGAAQEAYCPPIPTVGVAAGAWNPPAKQLFGAMTIYRDAHLESPLRVYYAVRALSDSPPNPSTNSVVIPTGAIGARILLNEEQIPAHSANLARITLIPSPDANSDSQPYLIGSNTSATNQISGQ